GDRHQREAGEQQQQRRDPQPLDQLAHRASGRLSRPPLQDRTATSRSSSSSSRQRPAPSTTARGGSSPSTTGTPVAPRSSRSRLASSAPPPVITMPLSTMSAASSGGVDSSAIFTLSTTVFTGSASASQISSDLSSSVFGTPATRSRPLTSMVWISS